MSQRETESIMNHFNDRTIQELVPFHLSASVAVNAVS